MSHNVRDEDRFYAVFQPSAFSQGIEPYYPLQPELWKSPVYGQRVPWLEPYQGFFDSDSESAEAAAEGRVPNGESMIDAVDRVNITRFLSAGVLESLNGLKDSDLMASVATADSAAQLKAAYWLHVAARSFGRFSDARERLENKADGLAERGEDAILREGSAAQISGITGIYGEAARSLKSEMDSEGGGNEVQQQVYEILAKGATSEAVNAAISRAKKQREITVADAESRDPKGKPCEDTWKSIIPGYCAGEAMMTNLIYGAVGLASLTALYLVYKKVKA